MTLKRAVRSRCAARCSGHATRTSWWRRRATFPSCSSTFSDARLDAPVLCRVLTVLHDCLTARLLELAFGRHGAPPVDYAWLVFGSAARNELTLASDQDNGLAYVDTDDPAVDEYFRLVAEDVNGGLTRCGIEPDSHFVLASVPYWRKTLTGWKDVFSDCLDGKDLKRVVRASVCFDYRQAAGGLYVTQALTDIMREAPAHPPFLAVARAPGLRHSPVHRGVPSEARPRCGHQGRRPASHPEHGSLPGAGARHHNPGDAGAPGRGLRLRRGRR